MRKLGLFIAAFLTVGLVIQFSGCKKKHINPYDLETQPDSLGSGGNPIDADNFASLYERIFEPQCAVSGCHDGTFPPDYRTIYSAYNTMVYEPCLTNDPTLAPYQFKYRIEPGKPDSSLVYRRLTFWIPGTSGYMPAYPPNQQVIRSQVWSPDSATWVNEIRAWIQNGAKDMYGNSPTLGNLPPQLVGMHATAYAHSPGQTLKIPASAGNVEIWLSFNDDSTPATSLTVNQFALHTELEAFDTLATWSSLTTGSTTTGPDMTGAPGATYTHKFTFNTTNYVLNDVIFVKVRVQDADQTSPVTIPHTINNPSLVSYYAIEII